MALSIECEDFRPLARNTLRGFAVIKIKEIRLKIKDVALHSKGSSTWAQLPAKSQVKNGAIVTSPDGKPVYQNILEFEDRKVSDAFSRAVVDAVLKFNPRALEATNG